MSKNIPIFLVNYQRFQPLQELVQSLLDRNYNNITIVDNDSSYPPLIEWYMKLPKPVKIYAVGKNVGPYVLNEIIEFKPYTATGKPYVWSDSDVLPIAEAPKDFIEHMVEMAIEHKIPKLGLSLVINDLPDNFKDKEKVIKHESAFTSYGKIDSKYGIIWKAPVDTTFAVNMTADCGYNGGAYRMNWPYSARHIPWYYDSNNLPPDEKLLREKKLGWCGHWSSM